MHGYVKLEIFRFNLFGGPNLIQWRSLLTWLRSAQSRPFKWRTRQPRVPTNTSSRRVPALLICFSCFLGANKWKPAAFDQKVHATLKCPQIIFRGSFNQICRCEKLRTRSQTVCFHWGSENESCCYVMNDADAPLSLTPLVAIVLHDRASFALPEAAIIVVIFNSERKRHAVFQLDCIWVLLRLKSNQFVRSSDILGSTSGSQCLSFLCFQTTPTDFAKIPNYSFVSRRHPDLLFFSYLFLPVCHKGFRILY